MKPLRYLRKYFIKYKVRLLLGVVFVTASNLFAIFPAQSVREAIDLIKQQLEKASAGVNDPQSLSINPELAWQITYFSLLVLSFAIIRGIFMYLMRQTIIVMSRLIEYDLKNEIFDHYQKLDQGFYRKNRTGDLMARISEDVSRVRMYTGPAIMYSINLGVTIVVVLTAMFSVNARLTWLVILPLPVLSYVIFKVNNLINRRSDAIQSQLSSLTSFVQEAYSGIRVIKSFAAEKKVEKLLTKETIEYKDKQMDLARVDAVFFPSMVFLTGLSSLITIYIGGMDVIAGKATIGNIAEFIIYINLLVWPVTSLGYTSSLIQRAAASQERINEFLRTKPELEVKPDGYSDFQSEIRFKQVSYTYEGKTILALQDIDFTIPKGSTFAILGTTGSGKTTLIQLLLRLMDCSEGSIEIDGNPLTGIQLKSWKNKIGYVPQDVFLFSDTIENNIAFGITETGAGRKEKVIEAAREAALHENIIGFENGYETRVGERGITLSGGQKQRVAIARAFIRNPEILIMDDCLSALDTKTEAEILLNLKKQKLGKTTIIVSHRVSSVKDANKIIVLDNGRIIEQGTHVELMKNRGAYHDIFEKQTRENMG